MKIRRWIAVALAAAAASAVALVAAGELLSRPVLHEVGPPPVQLQARPFAVVTLAGDTVAGWEATGEPGAGVVLLLHGVRGDRTEMVARALFLHRLGYSVVLIDLPGHGESPAAHITFGAQEARGVAAVLQHVAQTFPHERVGVIGVSLGAASLVLSHPDHALSAVVLESMFPTIADAVADRLELHAGTAARPLAPLLLAQLPLRLGVSEAQLRPIDALPALDAPVLIAAGDEDRHTTLRETLRLFDAVKQPKALWVVKGAAHVDLYRYAGAAYEAKVSAFFASYLRQGRPSPAAPALPPAPAGT